MAIIKCPECSKSVSDKANSCPNCGCPVSQLTPSGLVKIKSSAIKSSTGLHGKQKVTIMKGNHVIWEGEAGEVAEIMFESSTTINVKYHLSYMHYGGECSGTIDPMKSKKYNVSARQGLFSTKLVLQPVDMFDSD